MRIGIGAPVIVLIVALVSLGYLLYGYIDTSEKLNIVNEKATKLEEENQVLREHVNEANITIENLNGQIGDLEQQVNLMQNQARQLEDQLRAVKERNAVLEEQSNTTCLPANTIDAKLPPSASKPLTMLIPTLPLAVVATFVVVRRQMKSSPYSPQQSRLNNMEEGIMVKLSEDEMKKILKMRRGQ